MKAAYRIVGWKVLYEVTDKGKPAKEETPFEELRKSPLRFARYADDGWLISPEFKQMCKLAYTIGPCMELACYGLYRKLVDISRAQVREFRGWILDPKHQPVNAFQYADMQGITDQQNIKELFGILTHPTITKLELLNYPDGSPLNSPAQVEEGGGLLDTLGKNEGAFLNVTETEYNNNNKFKRKEDPACPQAAESFAPPALPDKVSDLVSGDSDSASVSGPTGQGGQRQKEIAAAKQLFLLELTELIHCRNSSDITTYRDIADQLEYKKLYETDLALFNEALAKARECSRIGQKPMAMFVAAMKKSPFNYIPKGTQIIRARLDNFHV